MAGKSDGDVLIHTAEIKSSGEDPEAPNRVRRLWSDGWILELVWSGLSLVCLAAVVVIVSIYNDKAVPHFSYGITLNAIISILTTAYKSLILGAVASAIGQLKWNWAFREDRRLYDFQIFDDGSRGPLGAVTLARLVHFRSLALLGAVVTVSSIALDPFSQQLLTFPTRTVYTNSSQAKLQQARNFTSVPDLASGALFTDIALSAMVAQPLYQALYSGSRDLDTICPTGNCTWPSFHSLSWRTQCQDKTGSVLLDGCDFSFDPSGPVDAESQMCSLSTGTNDPWSMFATRKQAGTDLVRIDGPQYVVWPTVDFNYADIFDYVADGTVPNAANNFMSMAQIQFGYNDTEINGGVFTGPLVVSAVECSLVPCVQEYSMSVETGRLKTQVLSTTYGTIQDSSTTWSASAGSEAQNFTIALEVLSSVALGIVSLLQGNATRVILQNTTNAADGSFSLEAGTAYGNRAVSPESLAYVLQYRGFESTMHDIASQLTHLTHNVSGFSLDGSAGVVESFVKVRWGWLAYPVAVVALGIAFVFATVVGAWGHHNVPAWKSSILPFLTGDHHLVGIANDSGQNPANPGRGISKQSFAKLSTLEYRAKRG